MAIEDLRVASQEEREKFTKENQAAVTARANRFHRVFVQNEDGAAILEEWINAYCFGGFTPNNASVTELAKAEARREFVSMIVTILNRSSE